MRYTIEAVNDIETNHNSKRPGSSCKRENDPKKLEEAW